MNFDRLEGLMADLVKSQKELRDSQKESHKAWDKRMQETDRRIAKSQEAFDRRMQERREEWDKGMQELRDSQKKSQEEWDKRMKETNSQICGIDRNIGDHAEQYFQNAFAESLTFGGQKYNEMISNMECHSEDGGTEFDIVLINGKSLAIIEVKSKIKLEFVKALAKDKISKFRRYLPKYARLKSYLGIAGFSFSKKVMEEAEKQGICIIRQVGKSIEMSKYSLKAY